MKLCVYLTDPTERPQVLDKLAKVFTITRVSNPCKAQNSRYWRLYVIVTIP
ncbi:hypothetical protein LJC60_05515 [Ruminococcaceae bacterium OttesenSCG-928-D13]|nr:hypothetical protein [Ruminococcaceae bacterium OttesenSCG-928-D13]